MDSLGNTAFGATGTVTFNLNARRAPGGNVKTNGKTMFVSTTGPAFSSVVFEVSADGSTWVAGFDQWGEAPSKLDDALAVFVIGLDAPYIRVRGVGGTDAVEADPEHVPPIEAVAGSVLMAELFG